MPRPRRQPDQLAVRLVAYVSHGTFEAIGSRALESGQTIGAFLDSKFGHPQPKKPEAPKRPLVPNTPHVWKVDSMNRNVCGNCGGQKIMVNGQPCPGASK